MKGFWPVFRKELYGMFMSPIFYVVGFIFLVISGIFFELLLAQLVMVSFQVAEHPELMGEFSMMELLLRYFLGNLSVVMLFIAPLLTMRLYAEERKSGTIELLFTYPVTDAAAVAGKFAACLTALSILLAATLPGVIAVALISSTLTRNQIIAAIISFGVLLVLWFTGGAKSWAGPMWGSVLEYLSVSKHFEGLSKGLIDSRDILFYLVFTAFFLFLTLRQMSSYRWRG